MSGIANVSLLRQVVGVLGSESKVGGILFIARNFSYHCLTIIQTHFSSTVYHFLFMFQFQLIK